MRRTLDLKQRRWLAGGSQSTDRLHHQRRVASSGIVRHLYPSRAVLSPGIQAERILCPCMGAPILRTERISQGHRGARSIRLGKPKCQAQPDGEVPIFPSRRAPTKSDQLNGEGTVVCAGWNSEKSQNKPSLPGRPVEWIDRTHWTDKVLRNSLDEPVPGGARFAYVSDLRFSHFSFADCHRPMPGAVLRPFSFERSC